MEVVCCLKARGLESALHLGLAAVYDAAGYEPSSARSPASEMMSPTYIL